MTYTEIAMALGSSFEEDLEKRLLDLNFAAEFILAAIEENDQPFLNHALARVIKVHGFSKVAKLTGIPRSAISVMTSDKSNPSIQTINRILKALGLELTVRPKKAAS